MVKNKSATFAANGMLLLFVATLAGLLWSRALLSIIHIVWLIIILLFIKKRKLLLNNNTLLIWSIIPLALFLLGIYQQPFSKSNYDYLLTLGMYPVAAFGTSILFKEVKKETCLKVWVILSTISLLLPLTSLLLNAPGAYVLYAQAKTLPVWMSADHVRYGLFISAAFLFLLSNKLFPNKIYYLLLIFIFLMIVVLSIRTAWVATGIIILIIGWQKIKASKYSKTRWLIPVFMILSSITAYKFFDSVKGKIDYMIYDWQSFEEKKFNADFSDGARRQINYTAWQTITTEDNNNVGWAAIPDALQKAFKTYFPDQKIEYGWPFNQWLFWWIGAGWWTMILFSVWLFYPLVWGVKNKNYPICCWTLVIAASCIVECTLSLQYGAFLHSWVTALLWIPTAKAEYDNS